MSIESIKADKVVEVNGYSCPVIDDPSAHNIPQFLWTDGLGTIELELTQDQAEQGFVAGGDAEEAVRALLPELMPQLIRMGDDRVKSAVKETGLEITDEKFRTMEDYYLYLVWIACGDIYETPHDYEWHPFQVYIYSGNKVWVKLSEDPAHAVKYHDFTSEPDDILEEDCGKFVSAVAIKPE